MNYEVCQQTPQKIKLIYKEVAFCPILSCPRFAGLSTYGEILSTSRRGLYGDFPFVVWPVGSSCAVSFGRRCGAFGEELREGKKTKGLSLYMTVPSEQIGILLRD